MARCSPIRAMPVSASDIAAIADADARENWQMLIAFRDHLLRHKTLEAAYVDLVRQGLSKTPPLFVNQLVHVILRNALDGVTDAQVVRAAELFFRPQRVTLHEGALIAADEEIIGGANPESVSPLVSMLGLPAEAHIDIINDENADGYWERSDQFDMALDLTAGRAGLAALAEAMRRWIRHIHGIEVAIEPLKEMQEVNLAWYVGLDADATRIGDLLWNGEDVDEATMSRRDWAVPPDLPRPFRRARQGQGRAGLSDSGDDAGQVDPHEAAESGHRASDQASGGGHMTIAPPLATIAVGVVVERSKSMSQWADFYWRPVSVLAGVPETAPWTKLSDDGERATFYAGPATIELYRTETPYYRSNLESGSPALWVALRADAERAALHGRRGHRRSGRRRGLDRDGDRSDRTGADAGGDPGASSPRSSPSTTSRRRSSNASATAPIRRRWRGGCRRKRIANERSGQFPVALVAAQKRPDRREAERRRTTRGCSGAAADAPAPDEAAKPAEPKSPAGAEPAVFDPASLPSIESIAADTDIRPFLQPGVPADLRNAALRRAWSVDPAIRNFKGLQENDWDFNDPNGIPGFGPLESRPRREQDGVGAVRQPGKGVVDANG